MIKKLKKNQIFVFGSNLKGEHFGGAADQAYKNFGAEWGMGVGLVGQSYAIPTMDTLKRFKEYANQFKDFALHYPEYEFLLTPVGTGIAGYPIDMVESLFKNLPPNVTKVGW